MEVSSPTTGSPTGSSQQITSTQPKSSEQSQYTTTTQQAIKSINFELNLQSILYAQYLNDNVRIIYNKSNNAIQSKNITTYLNQMNSLPQEAVSLSQSSSESSSKNKKKNYNNLDNLLRKLTRKPVHKIFINQVNQDIYNIGVTDKKKIKLIKIYTINYLNQIFRNEINIIVDDNKITNLKEQYFYTKLHKQSDIISVKNYYENVIKTLEIKVLENYLIILSNIDTLDQLNIVNLDFIDTTKHELVNENNQINVSSNYYKNNSRNQIYIKGILQNNIKESDFLQKVAEFNETIKDCEKKLENCEKSLNKMKTGGNGTDFNDIKQKLTEHIHKLLYKLKMYTNYNNNNIVQGGNGDVSVTQPSDKRFSKDLFMILSTYDFQKIQKIILYLANKYLIESYNQINIDIVSVIRNKIQECEEFYYRIDKILYEYIRIRIYYLYNRALLSENYNISILINVDNIDITWLSQIIQENDIKKLVPSNKINNTSTDTDIFKHILNKVQYDKHKKYILQYLLIEQSKSINENYNKKKIIEQFIEFIQYDYNILNHFHLVIDIKFNTKNYFNIDKIILRIVYADLQSFFDDFYQIVRKNSEWIIYNQFLYQISILYENKITNLNVLINLHKDAVRGKVNLNLENLDNLNNQLYESDYVLNVYNMSEQYKCYLDNNLNISNQYIDKYIQRKQYIIDRPCKRKFKRKKKGGRIEYDSNSNKGITIVSPIQNNINTIYDYYYILCNYFRDLPEVLNEFLIKDATVYNKITDTYKIWQHILKISPEPDKIKRKDVRKFINNIPFNYLIILCDLAHDFLPSTRATYRDKLLMSELKDTGFLFERFIKYNRPQIIDFFKQLKIMTEKAYDKIQQINPRYNFIKNEFKWCKDKDSKYWFSTLFEKNIENDRNYKEILYIISKIFIISHQQFYTPLDTNPLLYQINPTIYPEDIDFKCIRGSRDINFLNGRNISNNYNYASIHLYNNRLPITNDIKNYDGNTFGTLQDKPIQNYYVVLPNKLVIDIIKNMYSKSTSSTPSITDYKLLHQTNHFLCIRYQDDTYNIDKYKNSIDIGSTKYHFDCLITEDDITLQDNDGVYSILPAKPGGPGGIKFIKLIPVYNITNGPNTIDPNVTNSTNILKNVDLDNENIFDINLCSLTCIPENRIIFFVINYIAGSANVDLDNSDNNIFNNEIVNVMSLKQAIIYSQECFNKNKIVLAYFCANITGHQFNGYCILGFNQTYKKSIIYKIGDNYYIIKKSKFNNVKTKYRVDYLYVKYYVDDNENCDISNDIFINNGLYTHERGLVLINTRNTADGVKDIVKNIYQDMLVDDESDKYLKIFKDRSVPSKYYSLSFPIKGGNATYNTNQYNNVEGIQCCNPLNGHYIKDNNEKIILDNSFQLLKNGDNSVNQLYLNNKYDIYKSPSNLYFNETEIKGITQFDNNIYQLRLFTGVEYVNSGITTKFDYIDTFDKFKHHIYQLTTLQLLFKTWGDLSNILPSIIIFILSHLPNYKENFEREYLNRVGTISDYTTFLEYLNNINVFTGDDTCAILLANIISGVSGVRVGEQNTDFSYIHMNRDIKRSMSYKNWKELHGNTDINTFCNTNGFTGRNRLTFMEDSYTNMRISNNSFDNINLYETTGITYTDYNLNNRYVVDNTNTINDIKVVCSLYNRDLYQKLTDEKFFVGTWLKNVIQKYKDYSQSMLDIFKVSGTGTKKNDLLQSTKLDYSFIKGKSSKTKLIDIITIGYSNPEKIEYDTHTCNINDIPTKIKENMYDLVRIHNYYNNNDPKLKFIDKLKTKDTFSIKDTGLITTGIYEKFSKRDKKTELLNKTDFVKLLDFDDNGDVIVGNVKLYEQFKWNTSQ